MTFRLRFPPRSVGAAAEALEFEPGTNLVIIGANGSGKTRLAVWIEKHQSSVHRIAAQRVVTVPEKLQPRTEEYAENMFRYGNVNDKAATLKDHSRWQKKPAVSALDDFQNALSLLFAREEKRNRDYVKLVQQGGEVPKEVPKAATDKLVDIWRSVYKQRDISLNYSKYSIDAVIPETQTLYHADEMSDGERSVIYFAAQALCVAENSILLIDEPEIHLHRAILSNFWDVVEATRPDCLFIYITHDLEFAASRTTARKIVIRSYDGKHWTWGEIPSTTDIPEDVLLTLLGNRKPVIFIEGETGGLDARLYGLVYRDHLVMARGSAQQVVDATRVVNSLPVFANYWTSFGVIDRDYRINAELDLLREQHVYSLQVAEIENLFCTEEVICLYANLMQEDPVEAVARAKEVVFQLFEDDIDHQALKQTQAVIERGLRRQFGGGYKSANEIEQKLKDIPNEFRAEEIFAEYKARSEEILAQKDYNAILQIFNHKGLIARVAATFTTRPNTATYVQAVLSIFRRMDSGQVIATLEKYLPLLPAS